jgi:hypothetical protein
MSEYLEWLPIALLAGLAIAIAIPLQKLRVPWFVGAPVSGFLAGVSFTVIASALSHEPEPFVYVALIFATIYGTGFALMAYLILALWKRQRGGEQSKR